MFMSQLKEAALMNLDTVEKNWGNKYSLAIRT